VRCQPAAAAGIPRDELISRRFQPQRLASLRASATLLSKRPEVQLVQPDPGSLLIKVADGPKVGMETVKCDGVPGGQRPCCASANCRGRCFARAIADKSERPGSTGRARRRPAAAGDDPPSPETAQQTIRIEAPGRTAGKSVLRHPEKQECHVHRKPQQQILRRSRETAAARIGSSGTRAPRRKTAIAVNQ